MSYPADVSMSEEDTLKYNILTLAQYEVGIIHHRWKRNSGIE